MGLVVKHPLDSCGRPALLFGRHVEKPRAAHYFRPPAGEEKSHRPIVLSRNWGLTMAEAERGVDRKHAVIFVVGACIALSTTPQLTALAAGPAAPSRACRTTASCAGQPEHGRGVSGRRSASLSHEPPMRSGRWEGTKVPLTRGTFLRLGDINLWSVRKAPRPKREGSQPWKLIPP
jgi:hypothetical protein